MRAVRNNFPDISEPCDLPPAVGPEKLPAMQLESMITCPACGHRAVALMPTDACQFFYDCKGCGERLKPKPGDCCVFCSYGSAPCPPIQCGGCSA
jgi:hypothetical protein